MNREPVIFKGTKRGVCIHVDEGAPFSEILAQLRAKLTLAREFFSGAVVRVSSGQRKLGPAEKAALEDMMEEFGLGLDEEDPIEPQEEVPSPEKRERREMPAPPSERTLLVRRTLRSGQKLDYDGNVVIMGDVNPGAEVVCTGDIIVLGVLRGLAHAGIGGNTLALVLAFRLEPTQLRIAHYISRAPDEKLPRPGGPEVAVVKDDLIQIASYVP